MIKTNFTSWDEAVSHRLDHLGWSQDFATSLDIAISCIALRAGDKQRFFRFCQRRNLPWLAVYLQCATHPFLPFTDEKLNIMKKETIQILL